MNTFFKSLLREEQQFLLKSARKTLEHSLLEGKAAPESPDPELSNLIEMASSFVTLFKSNELRGCIGRLTPEHPLFMDVNRNSLAAAFSDPRFSPVTADELEDVSIEISVLSQLRRIYPKTYIELYRTLEPQIDGVVLKHHRKQATFLPSVWRYFTEPQEFVRSLRKKAGIDTGIEVHKMKISVYNVLKFSEDDFV